ncbi:hypothetical protein [Actinomadura alba]|uniref:Lipoprotein n=1 Tax=Actinomadura alba TaxID=406431 RepID=A0ABR7LHY1_9ACTN|nr:hypothetical protein [Actinomadura alba]MBC6464461.1 hypothetical protein [Actinomadura alba]
MAFRRAIAMAAAAAFLAACTSTQRPAGEATAQSRTAAPAAQAAPWAAGACAPRVAKGSLPTWARSGFSDAGAARIPHVVSARGDMIAALFAYPTRAWPGDGDGSKILWISRLRQQPSSPLKIDAYRDGSQQPVHREMTGGAGPSLIKLPEPGCWRLKLSWSGHSDTIDLRVAEPMAGRA